LIRNSRNICIHRIWKSLFAFLFSLLALNFYISAETRPSEKNSNENSNAENSESNAESKNQDENSDLNHSGENSDLKNSNEDSDSDSDDSKISFTFDEGIALARITRIQEQTNVSNFVWKDSLIGMYFTANIKNLMPFDIFARTEVFYPFLHTFNGMKVFAKQTILYAFDFLAGVPFRFDFFKYASLTLKPALHVMYQLSDEYHLFYFGAGGIAGVEIPIAKRWTIILDGSFTLDYPNWGGNRLMLPFDWGWQWQTSLGVRYSKKSPNRFHLLP